MSCPDGRTPDSPSIFARLAARALRATLLVDRAAVVFDRVRSRLVTALAPDTVLDAYNEIAHGSSSVYDPDASRFRSEWFPWEADAVARYFPAAPARVLVGGAGGGREALCLSRAGYEVTAFEPVRTLVQGLLKHAAASRCTALVGRYEEVPRLESIDGDPVTLSGQPPYDAGIMGWGSVAHVRRDADRVDAIRHFTALVKGPVLVSVYPVLWTPAAKGRLDSWLHGHGAVFSPGLGRIQTFDESQFRDLLSRARVEVLALDVSGRVDNWPHAVVRATPAE